MKDNIYINILLWAYDRLENGFTWDELKKQFSLSKDKEEWVRKVFLTASDSDRKFFELLRNDDSIIPNKYYYALNEKGMSAVIDYLELKEARDSSKKAMYIAIGSLLVAIIVGIIQIFVQIC